jgi:hypothetical protein
MRFEMFVKVRVQIEIFWVATLCVVGGYRHFGETGCFLLGRRSKDGGKFLRNICNHLKY